MYSFLVETPFKNKKSSFQLTLEKSGFLNTFFACEPKEKMRLLEKY